MISITVLHFDPDKGTCKIIDTKHNYKEFIKGKKVFVTKIGNMLYVVVGKNTAKENSSVSITNMGIPVMYGEIIILSYNSNGEFGSLSYNNIKELKKHIHINTDTGKFVLGN